MNKSIVIIPTFNEIDNIAALLTAVMNLKDRLDVLVVDDNSPDGTSDKVLEFTEQFSERIFLLKRAKKTD